MDGHCGGVTAAWQELAFPPLSVEGMPLCSAIAFQLGLGLGTAKLLLSRVACLDKHGGLLLKPLPAQQPCCTAVPRCSHNFILPGALLAAGHRLQCRAKGAPTLCQLQP